MARVPLAFTVSAALIGVIGRPAPAAPRGAVVRVPHREVAAPPALGRANAPVTIEFFMLPGSSSSGAALDRLIALYAKHPYRVWLQVRLLSPAGTARLPESLLEAAAQGKFFEFEAATRRYGVTIAAELLLDLARQVGVDPARMEAAWADGRHQLPLANNDTRRTRLLSGQTARRSDTIFAGRPIGKRVLSLGTDELEAVYQDAYTRARAALDRGVARESLDEVLRIEDLRQAELDPFEGGVLDEVRVPVSKLPRDLDDPFSLLFAPRRNATDSLGAELSESLDLRPWPVSGAKTAATTVVLFCNLRRGACNGQLLMLDSALAVFAEQVQLIWAPWFNVERDAQGSIGLFHDAVRCAQSLGEGWAWVEAAALAARKRGQEMASVDDEIDDLLRVTGLDRRAFARCLAVTAGTSTRFVMAANRAGISASPTLMLGGILYPGGFRDPSALHERIEQTLLPGILARIASPTAR